jgi:hypothetical protein
MDNFLSIIESFDNSNITDLEYFDKMLALDNIKIIYEDHYGKLIHTDYYNLIKIFNIQNWDNLPIDINRVSKITEYYNDRDIKLIPGIIYLWEQDNIYYIYDGLHKFQAVKYLNKNVFLTVYINESKNEELIIQDFINMNNDIIYKEPNELIKQSVCKNLADLLCKQYPKFISISEHHSKDNFNRDELVEYFSTFDINFNIINIENIIFKFFLQLNATAKLYVIRNQIKYSKKNELYNFYLFYLSKKYIKHKTEQFIKEKY